MGTIKTEKYLPLALHILGWVVYVSVVINGNFSRFSLNGFLLYYGLITFAHCVIFYLNYSFLIPRILYKVRLSEFLAHNLVAISCLSVLITLIQQQKFHFLDQTNSLSIDSFYGPLILRFVNITWFVLLSVIIRFTTDWYKKIQTDQERENEQLKTELSFLKAQINPHFLFNALNNLYALALKKSDDTPDKILQISAIMRYLLYETNDEHIALSNEIEIIQTYISLHELRNKTGEGISFQIDGGLENVNIPPLLLLPLVENVFKHGTYPVVIQLQLAKSKFHIFLSNKILPERASSQGGVGLQNLKRRLNLLFPDAHQLVFNSEKDHFTASLTLNLK